MYICLRKPCTRQIGSDEFRLHMGFHLGTVTDLLNPVHFTPVICLSKLEIPNPYERDRHVWAV
jgi:hypothetical protein